MLWIKTSKTDPKRWRQYLIASVRTIFYYNTTFSDKLKYLLQENIVTLNHNISWHHYISLLRHKIYFTIFWSVKVKSFIEKLYCKNRKSYSYNSILLHKFIILQYSIYHILLQQYLAAIVYTNFLQHFNAAL